MAVGDIRLEWDFSALPGIRRNGAVTGMLTQFGAKYTAKANAKLRFRGVAGGGGGYIGGLHPGPGAYGRAIYNVYPGSGAAVRDNSANNTLAKLMG
jgi:hypothetical protein